MTAKLARKDEGNYAMQLFATHAGLDKTGTTGCLSLDPALQVKAEEPVMAHSSCQAERAGFEPAVEV